MSPRIGPLVLAVMSLIARLAVQPAIAEILALVSFAVLTLVLQRGVALRPAARLTQSDAAILPGAANAPSPAAHLTTIRPAAPSRVGVHRQERQRVAFPRRTRSSATRLRCSVPPRRIPFPPPPPLPHSDRMTDAASTRTARRAGTGVPPAVMPSASAAAAMNATGSAAGMPASSASICRPAA